MSRVPDQDGAWWVEVDEDGGFYVVRDGVQSLPNPKFTTREEYEEYVNERSVGEETYPPGCGKRVRDWQFGHVSKPVPCGTVIVLKPSGGSSNGKTWDCQAGSISHAILCDGCRSAIK